MREKKPGTPARASQKRPPPPKKVRAERPRLAPEGPHRAGFALLLGRPNVGKSTLLNRLVGEHVAIVSPRPQTTRNRILGIVNEPGTQLCLIDAPGVHRAKGLFNRAMVEAAMSALTEVDLVLYLAEAGWPAKGDTPMDQVDPVGPFHRELLQEVKRTDKPVVLVLTKVDLVPKPLLLPLIDKWRQELPFREVYPLSALTGENVEGFIDAIRPLLPEGPPLFPQDTLTDQPERALAAELVREQIFLQTHDEIPYGTAVVIDEFDESERPLPEDSEELIPALGADPDALRAAAEAEAALDEGAAGGAEADEFGEEDEGEEFGEEGEEEGEEGEWAVEVEATEDETPEDEEPSADAATAEEPEAEEAEEPARLGPGLVRIHATIVVEREPHKGIVIGRRGERLKEIGTAARHHIERLLGCRVWLGLHVKVIPNWTERRAFLSELGYTAK